jgi:predicted aspartyl protease
MTGSLRPFPDAQSSRPITDCTSASTSSTIPSVKPNLKIIGLAPVFVLWGCASVLDEDGALAIAPYDIDEKGLIVVEAQVNGQGPFAFALDTGASMSVVFDEVRNTLELEPVPGKTVMIHGVIASGNFPLLNISHLAVGREVWADPRIALLPGETAATAGLDGILGVDFLRRYAVGFSTRDRVIRLYPPDLVARRTYRGWTSIPLEHEYVGDSGAALYFFKIGIGGQRIPALFDLGAGLNLINWAAARSLGLEPVDMRDDDLLAGAIESAPVVARIKFDEVTTGRIRWRDEEFTVTELEILSALMPGRTGFAVLGAELFTQRDFIIDFTRNRLLVNVAMDEENVFPGKDGASQTVDRDK